MVQLTRRFKLQGWTLICLLFYTPGFSRRDLHKESLLILQGQLQEFRDLKYWPHYSVVNKQREKPYSWAKFLFLMVYPCNKNLIVSPLLWNSWCQEILSCLPIFSRLEYLVKLYSYAGKAAPWPWWCRKWDRCSWKSPRKFQRTFVMYHVKAPFIWCFVNLYKELSFSRVWCTLRHCPRTKTYSAIELPCRNYFLLCRNNTSKWLPRLSWWLCGLFLVKVRILTF